MGAIRLCKVCRKIENPLQLKLDRELILQHAHKLIADEKNLNWIHCGSDELISLNDVIQFEFKNEIGNLKKLIGKPIVYEGSNEISFHFDEKIIVEGNELNPFEINSNQLSTKKMKISDLKKITSNIMRQEWRDEAYRNNVLKGVVEIPISTAGNFRLS